VAKSVSLILAGGNNNVTMGEAAAPLSIGGVFAIRTGDGRDTITLTRVSVVGAASIFTFGGNDLLQIETASSFTSTFLADMGTGNDTISIAQDPTGGVGEVFFSKSVTIKGNAGDDSLLLGLSNLAGGDLNSRVRFVAPINIVDGGLGTDTFNVANSQIVGAVTLVGWNP
jgi:hypothetical protein